MASVKYTFAFLEFLKMMCYVCVCVLENMHLCAEDVRSPGAVVTGSREALNVGVEIPTLSLMTEQSGALNC